MKIELSNELIKSISKSLYATKNMIDYKNFRTVVIAALQNQIFETVPDLEAIEKTAFPNLPKYRTIKKFGYYSRSSDSIKVRTIEPIEENKDYIIGLDTQDNNKLKKFLKSNITGNIRTVKQKIYE